MVGCVEVVMLLKEGGEGSGVGLRRDVSPIGTWGEEEVGRLLYREGRKPKKYWDRSVVVREL